MASPLDADVRRMLEVMSSSHANAIETIRHSHEALHDGNGYSCHITTATVAAGQALVLAITTPTNTVEAHMINAEGGLGNSPARLAFIEDGNKTVAVNTVTIWNRNRNKAASMTSYATALSGVGTYTAAGGENVLQSENRYSPGFANVSGSVDVGFEAGFIWGHDSDYVIVAENNGTTATSAYLKVYWIEEECN